MVKNCSGKTDPAGHKKDPVTLTFQSGDKKISPLQSVHDNTF